MKLAAIPVGYVAIAWGVSPLLSQALLFGFLVIVTPILGVAGLCVWALERDTRPDPPALQIRQSEIIDAHSRVVR